VLAGLHIGKGSILFPIIELVCFNGLEPAVFQGSQFCIRRHGTVNCFRIAAKHPDQSIRGAFFDLYQPSHIFFRVLQAGLGIGFSDRVHLMDIPFHDLEAEGAYKFSLCQKSFFLFGAEDGLANLGMELLLAVVLVFLALEAAEESLGVFALQLEGEVSLVRGDLLGGLRERLRREVQEGQAKKNKSGFHQIHP
jgi:hypothetical protein